MNLLHLKMTSSSDLNIAIPLRCPFHALAIVQVGFAGAGSFVHLHVSEFLCQQNLVNNLVTLYIPMWVMLKGFRVRMIGEQDGKPI